MEFLAAVLVFILVPTSVFAVVECSSPVSQGLIPVMPYCNAKNTSSTQYVCLHQFLDLDIRQHMPMQCTSAPYSPLQQTEKASVASQSEFSHLAALTS